MSKKKSMSRLLVEFGKVATPAEIDSAIDILRGFTEARKPSKPRKTRKDAGTQRVVGKSNGADSAPAEL